MDQDQPLKPVADDIPTSRAWTVGRRIYIRCGKTSTLNTQIIRLGAKWDGEVGARWVGTGKKDLVLPLIRDALARARRIEDVKAGGRWVKAPRGAVELREQLKKLGAVYDGDRKEWALPGDDAHTTALRLVEDHTRQAQEQRAQQRQEREAAARETPAERIARLAAVSGRTVLNNTETTLTVRDESWMRRDMAVQTAAKPGDVIRATDGGRYLVLDVKVAFWGQDACDDFAPHLDPHWAYTYTCVPVAPTQAEQDADAAAAARRQDAAAISKLIKTAHELTGASWNDSRTAIPPQDVAALIKVTYGSTHQNGGTLTLTRGGQVWWQHPGYYDDYIAAEGHTDEPAVVEQVRALLEGGPRTRGDGHDTFTIEILEEK